MLTSLFGAHFFGNLDVTVVFVVTAMAVYLNDHLPILLRSHPLLHRVIKLTVHNEFYWPIALGLLGLLMLLFVEAQMAVSSFFVLGYGLWLIRRAQRFVRI